MAGKKGQNNMLYNPDFVNKCLTEMQYSLITPISWLIHHHVLMNI